LSTFQGDKKEESTDFIPSIPSSMDVYFQQLTSSLQNLGVDVSAANSAIQELKKNVIVIGEVVSIQSIPPGPGAPNDLTIVHLTPLNSKVTLMFRFPDPNFAIGLIQEFQRAQNHAFIVRVTYTTVAPAGTQEAQNLIKSIEVVPRWTLGKVEKK
jgi:hypothetical protein